MRELIFTTTIAKMGERKVITIPKLVRQYLPEGATYEIKVRLIDKIEKASIPKPVKKRNLETLKEAFTRP